MLLGKAFRQLSYKSIQADREECHADVQYGVHGFRQLHQGGNEECQSGLEHGNRNPVTDIRTDKDPELPVRESLGERGECVSFHRFDLHIIIFIDRKSRDQL